MRGIFLIFIERYFRVSWMKIAMNEGEFKEWQEEKELVVMCTKCWWRCLSVFN